MKIYQQIIISLIITLVVFGIGVMVGQKYIKENIVTNTIYVPSEPIIDSVKILIPIKEIVPLDTLNIIKDCIEKEIYSELFPTKIIEDTIYISKSDSVEIIKDWASIRHYSETLFDSDSLGKCNIDMKVQYNRLSDLKYKYTPVIKYEQTMYTKKSAISPFIGLGVSTSSNIMGQVGVFIQDDWGVSFLYNKDFVTKSNNYGIVCLYKF